MVVVADGSSCVSGIFLLLRLCCPGVVGACVVLSVLSVVDVVIYLVNVLVAFFFFKTL